MITRSSKMVIRVPCATWIEKSDGGACGGDGIMDLEFDTRGFDPTKVGL
jgi:hypothetical protein